MEFGNLKDFKKLRKYLEKCLMDDAQPISCRLFDHLSNDDEIVFVDANEDELLSFHHSAKACNLADQITAISYLLSSPRSNIACAHLQGIFLVQLDILRETLREITQSNDTYKETYAEKFVRSWSGYIKHPSGTAFAHTCFAEFELDNEVKINTEYLFSISDIKAHERDSLKNKLQDQIVTVEYPKRQLIEKFISDCETRIQKIIALESSVKLEKRVQVKLLS
jgi:hypothetical protein